MAIYDILKDFSNFPYNIDSSTPHTIALHAKNYDGFSLLVEYDNLTEQGLLSNSYPFATLYKELTPDERLDIFPALVGLKALMTPHIQKALLTAHCPVEVLQSLNSLDEYFASISSDKYEHKKIQSEIIANLFESNCPVKIIPSSLLENRNYIEDCCIHNWDFENGALFHRILQTNEYDPKLEAALKLRLNIKSVEDYLKEHFIREKDVMKSTDNIDLTELVVAKLYTLKLLSRNKTKIEQVVNNPYTEDILENNNQIYGRFIPTINIIEIFPFMINTLREYFITSSHESYHAIQDRNIQEGDIFADPDVDIYSMDRYLTDTLGEGYYEENYFVVGIEGDAETKAQIDALKIEGEDKEQEDFEDLKAIVAELSEEESKYLDKIKANTPYFYIMTRTHNGERTKLTTLFQEVLNERYQKAPSKEKFKEELFQKYPIFKYTLTFDEQVLLKNPTDYIKDMENADEEEMQIYIQLLANCFNDVRYPRQDVLRKKVYSRLEKSKLSVAQKSGVVIALETAKDKFDIHFKREVN